MKNKWRKLRTVYKPSEIVKILLDRSIRKIADQIQAKVPALIPNGLNIKDAENFVSPMVYMNKDILESAVENMEFEKKEQIIELAEKVCNHIFDILGSGPVALGENIPWHKDFKSQRIWDKKYYKEIGKTLLEPEYFKDSADVKVPWELSRFQHLPLLGQAYHITKNPKYYIEFKNQILDWAAENPYKIGVNWACTMDVAIRLVNWIVAYEFFEDLLASETVVKKIFLDQIMASGQFVEHNLECDVYGQGNNHYLSDLVGLVYAGLFFEGNHFKAERWLHIGIMGLEKQMLEQVNCDGGSFEGSIAYHRLGSELLLNSAIVLKRNGHVLSEEFENRLGKMMTFISDYTKPSGLAPQFGDADDGRFIILDDFGVENKQDHRHLLAVAGEYFDRDDLRCAADKKIHEALWLFGKTKNPGDGQRRLKSSYYKNTGIYIFNKKAVYMAVKCGAIGQKEKGGHDHNDQLSYELNVAGDDIVVDSGTYGYSMNCKERQNFRRVKAHNLPQFKDWEQNCIKNDHFADLFCLHSVKPGQVLECCDNESGFLFAGKASFVEGQHDLCRSITFDDRTRTVAIKDSFEGLNLEGCGVSRVHLSRAVQSIELNGNEAVLKTDKAQVRLIASSTIEKKSCRISESYGTYYDSWVLQWSIGSSDEYKMIIEGVL